MSANSSKVHARYWQAVGYNENFVENWQDVISEKFQVPFAYCVHDKDVDKSGDKRKTHTHIIIAFPNTTTQKTALAVFKTIEKDGCSAYPNDVIQQVFNIRNAYDYLRHDTDDCRKKGKYQYALNERVTGNNFDIGNFEQLSQADKIRMRKELAQDILDNGYTNFSDFFMNVLSNYEDDYFEVCSSYSGFFERLTKGNFQKNATEVIKK